MSDVNHEHPHAEGGENAGVPTDYDAQSRFSQDHNEQTDRDNVASKEEDTGSACCNKCRNSRRGKKGGCKCTKKFSECSPPLEGKKSSVHWLRQ